MAAGVFLFDSAIGLVALVKGSLLRVRVSVTVLTDYRLCLIVVCGSADVQIKVRHSRIA